ncbi:MAG: hypothetical protein ACI825_001790, partial [Planctomycetota bacterium]
MARLFVHFYFCGPHDVLRSLHQGKMNIEKK